MQGVAATSLGFVVFGGVKAGLLNVTGIGVNTVGGVWYGIAKYEGKEGEKRGEKEEAGRPAGRKSLIA